MGHLDSEMSEAQKTKGEQKGTVGGLNDTHHTNLKIADCHGAGFASASHQTGLLTRAT